MLKMAFHFPLNAVLPEGRKLIVDHMTDTDVTEMFRMITVAVELGYGFGENEFENEEGFKLEYQFATRFVIKDGMTNKTIAWMILTPSTFCRPYKFIDPVLVVSDCERRQNVSVFCGLFAIDYCAWKRYDGILAETFQNHEPAVKAFKRLGLKHVGHLDLSAKLIGRGYVGSEFFFCDLRGKSGLNMNHFTENGLYSPFHRRKSKL